MMHLGFSLTPFGHDPDAWRQAPSREALGFPALSQQVLQAEQAGFDFVLLTDRSGQRPVDAPSPLATPFEPTTLASALATKARKIGFLAAAATYQYEPYNLARRFASLDSISSGRSGWTVIGGQDRTRDREYVDVVSALWDSWEDDAFIYDKQAGRLFVPEKMHVLNHKGENFSVRGPLNVNRSPQGKPVLAAFGGSAIAHLADVVFVDAIADARSVTVALAENDRERSGVRIFAEMADFAGTPVQIADRLERDFETGDVDGFVLAPPTTAAFQAFLETVVPELRKRGLLRADYSGPTLRDHLGLSHPAHPAAGLERAS